MTWRLNLPWLCQPPHDFRQQLKNLKNFNEDPSKSLMKMASFALDLNQLHLLYHARSKCTLPTLSLGIISNATTKLLAPCLAATGLRYGFFVNVIEGSFDQPLQDAIDPNSTIHQSQPDIILIALDHRGFSGLREEFILDENVAVEQAMEFVQSIRQGLLSQKPTRLIWQSIPIPPETIFGNTEIRISGSRQRRIEIFNQKLAEKTLEWGDLFFDVANLAANIGLDYWFDEPKWHVGKLSFVLEAVPLYTDVCLRLIAISLGKYIHKCLVLDLDNTLWGGVIGDDGLSGIVIGQGSAEGEAYLAVQKTALALRQRGIILCVCSKNDEEVARLPFKEHPDMLLREEHITIFLANWRDKASNLSAIAGALNISLDTLVFLDDNPAERQQVRNEFPEVGIPELPKDPALFSRTLLASGYFETVGFNPDDMLRADQYQANAKRAIEATNYRDLNEYLLSLDMVISFKSFDAVGHARIVQLIARSNQFNLTTQRYSEADVLSFIQDKNIFTLQIRLTDKFGDNGMISVIVCKKYPDKWEIDTWLMSCRVLNRRVEEAVLDHIVLNARKDKVLKLVGFYFPTERNSLVKDHYKKLGFTFSHMVEQGEVWELELANYQAKQLPIKANSYFLNELDL